ncbi:MAG TPA: hypothetical protein V6D19_02335 [Stenomitos sp.]
MKFKPKYRLATQPPSNRVYLFKDPELDGTVTKEIKNLIRIAYRDFEFYKSNRKRRESRRFEAFQKGDFIVTSKEVMENRLVESYNIQPAVGPRNDKEYRYEVLEIFQDEGRSLFSRKPTRFGFIAKRKLENGDAKLFVIFTGTRQLGGWLQKPEFRRVRRIAQKLRLSVEAEDPSVSFGAQEICVQPQTLFSLSGNSLAQILLNLVQRFSMKVDYLLWGKTRSAICNSVERVLSDTTACPPGTELYFSGHGLGATFATLSALNLGYKTHQAQQSRKSQRWNQNQTSPINVFPALYVFSSQGTKAHPFAKDVEAYKATCFRVAGVEDAEAWMAHYDPRNFASDEQTELTPAAAAIATYLRDQAKQLGPRPL